MEAVLADLTRQSTVLAVEPQPHSQPLLKKMTTRAEINAFFGKVKDFSPKERQQLVSNIETCLTD